MSVGVPNTAVVEISRRRLGRYHVPMPVHCQCRIGRVSTKDRFDRAASRSERLIVELAVTVGRREPGSEQQRVSLTKWHSSVSARFNTISRLGMARPLSTKLR